MDPAMRYGRPDAPAPGASAAGRYRALLETLDDGFCVLEMIFDPEGRPVDYRFLEVNAAFERQSGLHDAVGRTARELVPDLDTSWYEIYGRVATTGEPARFENHAPAMHRWFAVSAQRLGGAGSREVALVFRDITRQKDAERFLRERESLFRDMADASPAMLWVADDASACTFLSRSWAEYTGQSVTEGLGFGWTEMVHPDDREAARRALVEAAGRREPFRLEHRLRTREGTYRWAIDAGRPRFDTDGKFLGYVGLVIDIHERRLAEEAIRLADRRKNEFLGVLSHELRNPLAPIQAGIHLLDRVPPGSPQAERAKEVIRRQTDHLARLVGDLLDVTRITHGKFALHPARIDLRDVVRRTCEDHGALLEGAGLELHVAVPAAPVWVDADATRVAQAVGNLLQNAAKFTPRGGRVDVALESAAGRAVLRLSDTGVGLDAEDRERLFEPFSQGRQGLARTQGGLGLGLALVKGLVERHGGTVAAESAGRGRGTTFVVSLPLAEGAPGAAAATLDAGPSGRHVLIVEDNEDAAATLADLLELEGHRVDIASDGETGVALARARSPDVVLCDIGLPDVDGYEVARRLRAEPALAATRLVALSGYAMPEDRERALAAGFDAHLPKPPPLDDLARLLADGGDVRAEVATGAAPGTLPDV